MRTKYRHVACDTVTEIPAGAAEQYDRDPVYSAQRFPQAPNYHKGTWCAGCKKHIPANGSVQFVWCDDGSPVCTKAEPKG